VRGESSRGYEAPWEYARIIPAWSTLLVVVLAIAGSGRAHADTWWLWTPIVILSLLPHKESRYLIPVIPFLAISAARGLLRACEWVRLSGSVTGPRQWVRELLAPVLLLSILHDVGGWRLVRSNEGARLARFLRASGTSGIAAQDQWRLGGRSYLWDNEPLVGLPPAVLQNHEEMAAAVADTRWVALRSRTARTVGDPLMQSLGFARDESWRGEDYVLYVRTR